MTQLLNVSVSDGKYTVIQEADGRLHALRNGQPWERDIVGDKLVLCLAQDLAQAREDLTDAKELIDSLEQALASAQKCIDPTGHAPGAYTDPGPLTAADCSVARWPTLRDVKGKTFAERKAERAALLDQAKPATLEQAYEDAARSAHIQADADAIRRHAALRETDAQTIRRLQGQRDRMGTTIAQLEAQRKVLAGAMAKILGNKVTSATGNVELDAVCMALKLASRRPSDEEQYEQE